MIAITETSQTIPNDTSAIVYRHKKGGLGIRVAFFGGVGALLIGLPLIRLAFDADAFAFAGSATSLILGAGVLSALLIVVRAERRGRPCLILGDDRFTYLGYLKTKDAKWSDLGDFTVHESRPQTSIADDASTSDREPTRTLRAWIVKGAPDRARRKKPDFVIEDYFDVSLDELRLVLNRRIAAARGAGKR